MAATAEFVEKAVRGTEMVTNYLSGEHEVSLAQLIETYLPQKITLGQAGSVECRQQRTFARNSI